MSRPLRAVECAVILYAIKTLGGDVNGLCSLAGNPRQGVVTSEFKSWKITPLTPCYNESYIPCCNACIVTVVCSLPVGVPS